MHFLTMSYINFLAHPYQQSRCSIYLVQYVKYIYVQERRYTFCSNCCNRIKDHSDKLSFYCVLRKQHVYGGKHQCSNQIDLATQHYAILEIQGLWQNLRSLLQIELSFCFRKTTYQLEKAFSPATEQTSQNRFKNQQAKKLPS